MKKSMQTHFDGVSIGIELCQELKLRGVEHFRIDGQNRLVSECLTMLTDADMVEVEHLLILNNFEVLESLREKNIEWMNEPNNRVGKNKNDIKEEIEMYHHSFLVAYEICQKQGHKLHGPCISNTNQRSIDWLNGFVDLGIPNDIVITYHTYRDNLDFNKPHRGFSGRGEPGEMKWIKAAANGRAIACSEVGYDSTDDFTVAENMKKEFELAESFGALFCTYYQLNDDVIRGIPMGARRSDGSWKPVMNVFYNDRIQSLEENDRNKEVDSN